MIYFLIPVFNEVSNLEELARNLRKAPVGDSRWFVFVDDGSIDGSADAIRNYFKGEQFVILGDGSNHGPGHGFNTGFEWIIRQNPPADSKIITLESDNTSDTEILPAMLGISRMGYTLVLASVYAQGGGFDQSTWLRKLLSGIANLVLRFVFNIHVQTLSSFYRVYDFSLIQKIKVRYGTIIEQAGYLSMVEILLKAIRQEATIIEVPMVLYSRRRKGKSKMNLMSTSFSYLRFLLTNNIR